MTPSPNHESFRQGRRRGRQPAGRRCSNGRQQTLASVAGAVILITILTHYFVIAVAVVLIFYFYVRSSTALGTGGQAPRCHPAIEPLLALFRDAFGLATIRAYRETDSRSSRRTKNAWTSRTVPTTSASPTSDGSVYGFDMLGALLVLIVALLTTASSTPITAVTRASR